MATNIGSGWKIKDGKLVPDEKAREAKLDLCTRLKRRNSKKISVKRRVN